MAIPEGIAPTEAHVPFDMADAATALLDATGIVVGWSTAAERLLGYPAPEVLKRPGTMLLAAPEDAAKAVSIAAQCGEHGSWGGLLEVRHQAGHRLALGLRVSAVTGLGDGICWLISAIDVATIPTWAVSGSLLQAFLTRSPIGMAVLSPDLRYVWINDTLERYGGVPRGQRLGRRMADSLPGLDTEALEAQMRQVLETGVPVIDYEYRGWTLAEPHQEHAYSTSFFRLDDADGHPVGVCYMGIDVTDRWRARERLALLSEASEHIGSTLDVMRTAQELAEFAVPGSPTSSPSTCWTAVLRGERAAAQRTRVLPPFLRGGPAQSIHEGCPESVAAPGSGRHLPGLAVACSCLASGRPSLDPTWTASPGAWAGDDPAPGRGRSASSGCTPLMVVPMRARGTTLGVASFVRHPASGALRARTICCSPRSSSRGPRCASTTPAATPASAPPALALQRSLLPRAAARAGRPSRWPPATCRPARRPGSAATGST